MSSHPGFGAHTDPTFKSKPRPTGEVIRRVGVYLRPYLRMAAGTPPQAAALADAEGAHARLRAIVLECLDALDQLDETLVREGSRLRRLERGLADAGTADAAGIGPVRSQR